MLETSAQPELLARLERLAAERHTDRDTLLSEAIAAYLEREETSLVWMVKNAPDEPREIIDLPSPPLVVHLRSPRFVYDKDYVRPQVALVEK